MVKFTVAHLIAKLESRDSIKITAEYVSEKTGLSYPTVLRLVNPSKVVRRIESPTVEAMLEFFRSHSMKVKAGDMLVEEPDKP